MSFGRFSLQGLKLDIEYYQELRTSDSPIDIGDVENSLLSCQEEIEGLNEQIEELENMVNSLEEQLATLQYAAVGDKY